MILIDQKAPDFSNVPCYQKGKEDFGLCRLSEFKDTWLVLFFYPRDFTFICPTEIKGFETHQAEFSAMDAKVLAASTDSTWCHKAWFERDLPMVTYPILSDANLKMSRDYQVLNEETGEAQRGLFIIDPEGIVKYALVSAGSVGRSVKEVLRVLKALQSGELCPVEWEPGEMTLGKA